jgi:hypothetical protein
VRAYSEEMIWYFLSGFTGVVWVLLLGNAGWNLLRKPPGSVAQRVRMFGQLLLPLGGVILALNLIGQQGGWWHGGAKSTLGWAALPLSGAAVVWAFGEDRLMKVLAARGADRQGQSE